MLTVNHALRYCFHLHLILNSQLTHNAVKFVIDIQMHQENY
jgi:hypothetical protein